MKTLLAIDFDKHAAATYSANFPGVEVRRANVADQVPTLPYADVVLAGFPCQPHSLAGKRLASDDERDGGDTFVSAVRKVQPRMFLGENVPGLLTSEDGHYVVRLVHNLEAAGYRVEYRVLDAVDYGVPQFRARVFFWGIRNDVYESGVRWQWPKRTHVDPATRGGMFGNDLPAWVTVGQALGIWYPGCGFEYAIHRGRGASQIRPDHPISEPSPTVTNMANGGSGTGLDLVTRRGGGEICPIPGVNKYRWSDAMLAKHPPASPASPASTVQAKYFKGGAEGLVEIDPKHPMNTPDAPAVTMRSGGNGHGHTNNSLRVAYEGHGFNAGSEASIDEPSKPLRGVVPGCNDMTLTYDHGVAECAEPAPTLKAGGNYTIDTKQKRTEAGIDNPSGSVAHDDRRALKSNGKYVRRLTPLECARLQSVPDSFRWPEGITKTAQYRIVGNGMACAMMAALAEAFQRADPKCETMIDLFCGGGLGATGWHGMFWKMHN